MLPGVRHPRAVLNLFSDLAQFFGVCCICPVKDEFICPFGCFGNGRCRMPGISEPFATGMTVANFKANYPEHVHTYSYFISISISYHNNRLLN
jgi:hypothetical protein